MDITTPSAAVTSPVALDIHTTFTIATTVQRLALIPIPAKAKAPVIKDWQTRQFIADDFDTNGNAGLRLDGLADGDMDSLLAVKLAPHFMPETKMVFGRASKPRSHYVYRPDKAMKYVKYTGLDKGTLLECRTGSGHQTVIPPSVHSSGEQIAFADGRTLAPTEVSAKALAAAFGNLAVATLIASVWNEGGRHDLALAVTGFMLKAGAHADVVTEIMQAVAREFDDEGSDRGKAIEDTVAKFEHDPDGVVGAQRLIELLPGAAQAFMRKVAEWLGLKVPRTDAIQAAKMAAKRTKPVIYVSADQYDVTTDEAFGYLVAGNTDTNGPILFQRAGELQRVRVAPDHRGVVRPFITPVGMAAMRERLMRVADWIGGQDPGHAVPVQVPEFIASNILQLGEWPGVPLLRDITETPVITASGKIIVAPGYQAESQLWYCPPPGFEVPPVADAVSKDMAVAARDTLLDLLADFIFEDEASRAHAFAYLILPFVRELIDGPTPLHGISAPRRGTGKGLLTDVGALIATGKEARAFSWKDDEAELAKTITSFLVQNAGGVLGIDNMEGTVASGVFARLLTSTVWSERLLGTNNISGGGGVPNRAVWYVNGNNIGFSDEIERRTMYIRLLTDRENPEERTGFRHPMLKAYVLAERGRLVHAALTLARYAYQLREAGLPSRALLGSFEAYDELLGGLLAGVELPGWMGNREALRSRSTDEVDAWRELVCLWDIQRWGQNLPAGAVFERARVASVLPEQYTSPVADMTREFGKALAKLDGQVVGPYRVVSRLKSGRRLYSLTPAPTPPGG